MKYLKTIKILLAAGAYLGLSVSYVATGDVVKSSLYATLMMAQFVACWSG